MKKSLVFILAALGVLGGGLAAYLFGIQRPAQPPAFAPVSNPYDTAIFANGIIESDQFGGSNINIYPEVSGRVKAVFVREGQLAEKGSALMEIDDSVQRAATDQLRLQAQAALAALNALKAQPRAETLAIAQAQVNLAAANLKVAQDQYEKRSRSYILDPKSISKDVLDTAKNTVSQAAAALDVARTQYELTKAGAWSYDLANVQVQYEAAQQGYEAAQALLEKYTIRADQDGMVLATNIAVGTSVTPQGVFDSYSQAFIPVVTMSSTQQTLSVRCYVDEILVARLPTAENIQAQMSIRGTEVKVPLQFVRVQPYVSPKLALSNQRQEKVDLRVLPVIFRFYTEGLTGVYPGQLVDVYIGTK